MKNIYGFTLKKLEEYFASQGENPAKGKIVFKALYRQKISDFSQIEMFSSRIIEMLKNDFEIPKAILADKSESRDACKFLFTLSDGSDIETVLMKQSYGNSVCVSTQVGCNMDCAFCESGRLKKVRNLSAGEMVQQVLYITDVLKVNVTNIVLMGIGEPFDNYDEAMDFIEIVTDDLGLAIASGHVTVSTSGIAPKIIEFSKRTPVNGLTVSLHAPNDEIRTKLMPINKKYPISELLDAVKVYIQSCNKKVTLAYIMIDGVNDSDECARELAYLLKDIKGCCVNLIPYNKTSHSEFKQSPRESITSFFDILKQNGINVTIRHKFGDDMNAACGQLRAKRASGKSVSVNG